MKSKLTENQLVRAMFIEAEDHIQSEDQKVFYFVKGFEVCVQEGMNKFGYWRNVARMYPSLADKFYSELLNNKYATNEILEFLRKISLLK